ncbi:unnamed protein product, partial [Closterium sp. NIES-53]
MSTSPGRQLTLSTNSRSTSSPISRSHPVGFPWSASPKSTPYTRGFAAPMDSSRYAAARPSAPISGRPALTLPSPATLSAAPLPPPAGAPAGGPPGAAPVSS